jgi:GDP-mannose 6-dehydrogenase
LGHDQYVATTVLKGVHESNENQKRIAFELIERAGKRKVCFIGLSFKEGTDDLRYSPSVDLAEKLIGKGYQITIFDENVHLSKLVGANKSFIDEHLPHLSELIVGQAESAIAEADVVLINHRNFDGEKYKAILKEKVAIVDLVRIHALEDLPNYVGLCW